MRASIAPGTGPEAIRVSLGTVCGVIRLEVVARRPMVAPDDHAPDEVCAGVEIRQCARALHQQAEALRSELTRALPQRAHRRPRLSEGRP